MDMQYYHCGRDHGTKNILPGEGEDWSQRDTTAHQKCSENGAMAGKNAAMKIEEKNHSRSGEIWGQGRGRGRGWGQHGSAL